MLRDFDNIHIVYIQTVWQCIYIYKLRGMNWLILVTHFAVMLIVHLNLSNGFKGWEDIRCDMIWLFSLLWIHKAGRQTYCVGLNGRDLIMVWESLCKKIGSFEYVSNIRFKRFNCVRLVQCEEYKTNLITWLLAQCLTFYCNILIILSEQYLHI